eukprot:COSAG01_NODE_38_length_33931_cov_75.163632_29_plen_238_part_00
MCGVQASAGVEQVAWLWLPAAAASCTSSPAAAPQPCLVRQAPDMGPPRSAGCHGRPAGGRHLFLVALLAAGTVPTSPSSQPSAAHSGAATATDYVHGTRMRGRVDGLDDTRAFTTVGGRVSPGHSAQDSAPAPLVMSVYPAHALPGNRSRFARRRRLGATPRSMTGALAGNPEPLGYFYVLLRVGTPGQLFTVIIDTGSSLLAIPCGDCRNCGKHTDPRSAIMTIIVGSVVCWSGPR